MSVTELEIRGMHCASCAASVARVLRGVPGVDKAAVNLATERATVLHKDAVDPSALIAAVEGAGYGASTALDEDVRAEEARLEVRRKGWLLVLAVALCVPTVAIAMFAPDFPGKSWLLCALALPVWAVVGYDFHRGAIDGLRSRTASMDTLISLGSTAAFGLGIYGAIGGRVTYFDTASAIVTLVFAGKYLESRARVRSSQAMRDLLELRPALAHRLLENGSTEEVPVDLVRVDDVLRVAPGERVPVDGCVIEGTSSIDRSMLTGESTPVDVAAGAHVEAGTLNGNGALLVRAVAVGAGTELARIIEIVRRAQGSTPAVQRLADRVAAIFVPSILAIALATFVGWLIADRGPIEALVAAVAVLVVACPCALGLATPTAVIAGIGAASRRGVLFKDSSVLERTARVTTVLFDKTGTLTRGTPVATAFTSDRALTVAAALESASTHPLARAIVEAAKQRKLQFDVVADAQVIRGFGISGSIDGAPILAGNASFLTEHGVACTDADDENTHVFVAQDGALVGRIDLRDTVRAQAAQAVSALHKLGLQTALVSGDAQGPVSAAAASAGIDRFYARSTPEDKQQIVQRLQREGERVAFAGDGINDAPALASADAGFAMGAGTAIALETAGAAILSNDPRAVADAIVIARATMRTIAQNLFWAFAYNVVLIPLAAFGIVQPVFAAAAMGLSSLFVVGNSLRLGRAAGISGPRAASDP
jgi:P-type Cu+ transporter